MAIAQEESEAKHEQLQTELRELKGQMETMQAKHAAETQELKALLHQLLAK
eukprot:COSAG04_NODE_225_length_19578_cov_17.172647_4_plen_51_part_00